MDTREIRALLSPRALEMRTFPLLLEGVCYNASVYTSDNIPLAKYWNTTARSWTTGQGQCMIPFSMVCS